MSIYDQELADTLEAELIKRARKKRCQASVSDKSLEIRSGQSTDPRCQRAAVKDGLCRQHGNIHYCQARGCERKAVTREGKWWFCRQHFPLWRTHNRIVSRIMEIPVRD